MQKSLLNSLAVRRDHENVRCAIELGGQDAKMVFFERDEKSGATTVADMRMNGSCAGGTGAFIDEMAALLKVPVEQFDELAARGQSVHQVSGRCGVYAKTDIQPLLNRGFRRRTWHCRRFMPSRSRRLAAWRRASTSIRPSSSRAAR